MGWMEGFFQGFADRFGSFNRYYRHELAAKDSRGNIIDTGLGFLVGTIGGMTSQFLADLFKRKPEDPNMKNLPTPGKDDQVTVLHQRLYNDNFVKNDLPKIKNDTELEKYFIKNVYGKYNIKPGQSKAVDDAVLTNAGSYFNQNRNAGEKSAGSDWLDDLINGKGKKDDIFRDIPTE